MNGGLDAETARLLRSWRPETRQVMREETAMRQAQMTDDRVHGNPELILDYPIPGEGWFRLVGLVDDLPSSTAPRNGNGATTNGQAKRDELSTEELFEQLATAWLGEAYHQTFSSYALDSDSYRALRAMGTDIVPMVVDLIRDEDSPEFYWLDLLAEIAESSPAEFAASPPVTREDWVAWADQLPR